MAPSRGRADSPPGKRRSKTSSVQALLHLTPSGEAMDAVPSASFISTSEVLSAIHDGRPPLIVDVRRQPVFRAASDMIAGALWRYPERVAEWAGGLPRASR